MTKYLITGGCGFIGSHLAEELIQDGCEVRILDDLSSGKKENIPQQAELLIGSITEPSILKKSLSGVDGVFHLAAIPSVKDSIHRWAALHRVNIGGTVQLYEILAHAAKKIPLIYASSACVYGNTSKTPLQENIPLKPVSPYGIDKYSGEQHAFVLWEQFQIPSISFRFFNVFGPRQDPQSSYSGVISIFLENIAQGNSLKIYGDGEQVRDFVYVKDVAHIMSCAMRQHWKGALTLNLCTGKGTSVNYLIDKLKTITGKDVQKEYLPAREGDIRFSIGDPSALKKTFHLEAKTTLEEGLKTCV